MKNPTVLAIAALVVSLPHATQAQNKPPRLVLQITVDQLRGDLPGRYRDRLGNGGFLYLMDSGTVYADAHHAHANTETIVGHVTLATGAHPSAHGMVGNIWFDRSMGRDVYNIQDERYPLLSKDAGVDDETEIDPTQRTATTDGRSPSAIMVSTLTDELSIHTAGRSKIFAVSVKDRGAVSMAGHGGKAFWFSKAAGEFVTSSYYYDAYPDWVVEFNERQPTARYEGRSWELINPQSTYLFGDKDDVEWETSLGGFGRTFPHPFGDRDDRLFTTLLTISPAGDEMTLEFAKAIIVNEKLGRDDVPDYLSVSFSSTDYVGHIFGPSSLESEDNILQLDETLAELLAFVDEQVGLDLTLVVLSADHGGPEVPGYLRELGIDSDFVHPGEWAVAPAIARLEAKFGIGEKLIVGYAHPYVTLNRTAIAARGLDRGEVERAVAAELVNFPGVAYAISSTALLEDQLPDVPLIRAVRHNFNPKRSGDVYVVFEPQRFANDFDGLTVASTHGSPWTYDTYVPVIFAGAGIRGQVVHRRIETVDVARTIAAYLGVKPPSGAFGNVLHEVMGGH
jgi:predicted AlkP superfamily pyrophosphatase or phosphodiesterase